MIGIPLAQYAGYGAPVQPGAPAVVRVKTLTVTSAQISTLNTVPAVIAAGKAGRLMVPLGVAWDRSNVPNVNYAAGSTPWLVVHTGFVSSLGISGISPNITNVTGAANSFGHSFNTLNISINANDRGLGLSLRGAANIANPNGPPVRITIWYLEYPAVT